jgi:hypothetical protein
MGLYDALYDRHGVEWQTKSFPRPSLDHYRITDEGHLEKGDPLDLPKKYNDDDFPELIERINQIIVDGPRFAWTRHHFTGALEAITQGTDGEPCEARFEFREGTLV